MRQLLEGANALSAVLEHKHQSKSCHSRAVCDVYLCTLLDAAYSVQVRQLVNGADAIGAVLVYRHQGFLPNKRQLRMGGLAALEMAQTLRHLVRPTLAAPSNFLEMH